MVSVMPSFQVDLRVNGNESSIALLSTAIEGSLSLKIPGGVMGWRLGPDPIEIPDELTQGQGVGWSY